MIAYSGKDDSRFLDDASSWVLGWDVSPKQRTLDDSLIKWYEDLDNSGRALREAESERQALRSKLKLVHNYRLVRMNFLILIKSGWLQELLTLRRKEL